MTILPESRLPLNGGSERPPYGLRTSIEAVKAEVTLERYLSDQGVELRHGRARCPIHGGDNPDAFAVYGDEGRWHCFRCSEGGDVIDLCRAVEGGEVWEAMMTLAMRYGVELPGRPDRWHQWQGKKGDVRKAATQHIARVYQRRLTRVYAPLVLVGGETPEEELAGLQELASALWPVSLNLAGGRVSGEE